MIFPKLIEIATVDVVCLPKEATLQAGATLMEQHNIRSLIVVFAPGDYRIVQVPDLIAFRLEGVSFETPLGSLRLATVPTIAPDAHVFDGIALIKEGSEHLCLVHPDRSLAGIVSYSDLLGTLDLKALAETKQLGDLLVGLNFFTVEADTPVREVFDRMRAHGHNEAIITEKGRSDGILTRGDVVRHLAQNRSMEAHVGTVASRPLVGVPSTMNIQVALEFCKKQHFKRIIVQNAAGDVVGLVSQREVVTLFYNRWNYFLREQKEELARLNQELQEQKETLERITDTIGEGLYVMDGEGVITHANESMEKILGYSRRELLGKVAHELFHAHYHNYALSLADCPIFRTIKSLHAYEGVEEFVKKDGTFVKVRVTSQPLIAEGRAKGSVTTFSDITRELAMQERLKESEAWFRGFFDLSPDGIVIIDPQTTGFVDFNKAAYTNLGYTKAAFAELKIGDVDALDSPNMTQQRIREIEANGRSDFETQHRAADGTFRHVFVSVLRVWRRDRAYLMAIFRDTTRLKEAELRLQRLSEELTEQVELEVAERLQSEAKYRNLFNAVPDAIVVHGFDENGLPNRFSEVNESACRLFGLEREVLLKKGPKDVRYQEEESRILADLAEKLRQTGSDEGEERFLLPDGNIHTVERISRYQSIGGKPTVFTVLRDVTRKREMEKEHEANRQLLIQKSRMAEMGSMVGAIAHQWKQPLNTIGLIIQDIGDGFVHGDLTPEMMEASVEKAMAQVEFMGETIDDFRNFFKPSVRMCRFSLKKSVEATIRLLGTQLEKNGIAVTFEGDAGIRTLGYENEFKQVILNIVNNAKEVLLEKKIPAPAITITVQKEKDRAIMTIADNGGGILPELLPEKLFEPFHSTKGEKGTGIGLSLARQIMAKMDGKITARNNAAGAVFEITLPCTDGKG